MATSGPEELDTDDYIRPRSATLQPSGLGAPRIHVDLAALSDPGLVRTNNEDHYLAIDFGRYLRPLATSLPAGDIPHRFEQTGWAMAVADGLGGEEGGEVASRLALTTLLDLVLQTPDWIMSREEPYLTQVEQRTEERLHQTASVLSEQQQSHPELAAMGTTLTIASSLGRDLLVVNLGDSRAYLWRKGQLVRLTRDHTFAQDLADLGLIPMADVARHHLRHVLTRGLGGTGSIEPEFHTARLEDGDRVLVCSDGLTNMVPDASIAETFSAMPTSEMACQALVERALARGGHDNVTVIVAGYRIRELGA